MTTDSDLNAEIEAAIRSEILRPSSRAIPISTLAWQIRVAVLAAIRGAGYEVARDECGRSARG